jgi:hypothetical protein
LGLPFTRWSLRKLATYVSGGYRATDPAMAPKRIVKIGH